MPELTRAEWDLLEWLGKEESSQYGECYGQSLDVLCGLGLAEVMGEESGLHNTFIAKGRGLMYRAVRVTERGHEVLQQGH
jgi:hypothetical protein